MQRRTILFVLPTLNLAGAQKVVLEIVRGLDPGRYACAVCCLLEFGHYEDELRERDVALHLLRPRGLLDVTFPLRLARLLRAQQIDLVSSHFHLFDLWVGVAARRAGVPVVVTKHDTYLMDPLPKPVLRMVERWTQRLSTRYTAVSRAVADFLVGDRGVDAERVQVIHNGIDPQVFADARAHRDEVRAELGFAAGHRVIGTVANFHRRKKGYEVLVDAVPDVVRRFPEARFLWVGGEVDGLQAETSARLRDLGLAERVVMAGRRGDVPRLLAAMDAFVLPSTFEGLGIVVAEAMASGLPVVASEVGGIPEVVAAGETGLLVPVGDAKALGDAICAVLADPDRARQLGRSGQQRAEQRFGVRRMVDDYAAVFDACF